MVSDRHVRSVVPFRLGDGGEEVWSTVAESNRRFRDGNAVSSAKLDERCEMNLRGKNRTSMNWFPRPVGGHCPTRR